LSKNNENFPHKYNIILYYNIYIYIYIFIYLFILGKKKTLLLLSITDDLTSGQHGRVPYGFPEVPTYLLTRLVRGPCRSRKDFFIGLEQDLADLEGPPQAVLLTREQNKFLAYLFVPYPAEFFLRKGYFILSQGEKYI
jgi:hypothetical protein